MAILKPWEQPENPSEAADSANNWLGERERDRAGAGDYTADHESASGDNVVRPPHWQAQSTERDESQSSDMEVRNKPAPPIRFGVIGRDAYETAKTVLTGEVFTARPPSMRDRYERVRRAHWAGDADVLRRAGQVASVPPLVLSAVCHVGLWVSAPLRFYVFLAIGLIVVLIAVI